MPKVIALTGGIGSGKTFVSSIFNKLNKVPCFYSDFEAKKIMNEIKKLKPGKGNEIHITDAIKNLIFKGEKFYGNIFGGKYLDCGSMNGYIKSTLEIAKSWNYVW